MACCRDDHSSILTPTLNKVNGVLLAARQRTSSAKLARVRDMPRVSSHLVTTAAAWSVVNPSSSAHSASASSAIATRFFDGTSLAPAEV